MRRPGTAIYRKLARWEGILGNLGKRLEDIPHLKTQHEALRQRREECLALDREIRSLQGRLYDAQERLDQVAAEGEQLRGRLSAALQAEFGFESPRLQEFGLKPRRPRGRRKKTPEAAPDADVPASDLPS
jgi:septal ring factor EnvC (AmiA/AmiB activator)